MTRQPAPPRIGEPAPPLELPTLEDALWRLADLQGKRVLVSFLRHAG